MKNFMQDIIQYFLEIENSFRINIKTIKNRASERSVERDGL